MGDKAVFVLRWVLCAIGLWISVRLFGVENYNSLEQNIIVYLLAGLIFSIVNSVLKPIVTILSLPFVLVTLGLFMLVINGFMVWLTVALAPGIEMTFGWSIISGIILSLVNYLVGEIRDLTVKESK